MEKAFSGIRKEIPETLVAPLEREAVLKQLDSRVNQVTPD